MKSQGWYAMEELWQAAAGGTRGAEGKFGCPKDPHRESGGDRGGGDSAPVEAVNSRLIAPHDDGG